MVDRLRYYLQKAGSVFREQGFIASLCSAGSFLLRRRFFLQFLAEAIEYHGLARFRSVKKTLKAIHASWARVENPLEPRKGHLIYASYDRDSELREHVFQQLDAFHQLGYAIVFVSTSPELNPTQVDLLRKYCDIVLHRKNDGYDFASWKLGYEILRSKVMEIGSLILMNDSCIGPAWDLSPVLEKMANENDAVYGMTKSYEITEYLQSYFLHFGKSLVQSGLVEQYFSRIRILRSKWGIVRYFEIGGSTWLRSQGVEFRALVDPQVEPVCTWMKEAHATDPVKDPIGKLLVEKGLLPFYKRSNWQL